MCVRACVMRDIINYCASVCTLSLVVGAKVPANVLYLYMQLVIDTTGAGSVHLPDEEVDYQELPVD